MDGLTDASWRIFLAVNEFARATPWLHGPAAAYATYGPVLFGVLILVAIWHVRHQSSRRLAAAVWAGLGGLLALAVNQPIGPAVAEVRPYASHPDVLVLVSRTTDWSFLSDHSLMAAGAATGLLLAWPTLGRWAWVAALLMALTRVYVGAHFPHDVIAGLVVGTLVSLVGWVLLRRPLTRLTDLVRSLSVWRGAVAAIR